MRTTNSFKILKGRKSKTDRVPSSNGITVDEYVLAPITLTGIVVPWTKELTGRRDCHFKLACFSGAEYFIVADSEWKEVLEMYRWEEVKVVGLLNLSDMTLIPQKVFPKGPRGETESAIDLAAWKARDLAKKVDAEPRNCGASILFKLMFNS